MVWNGSRLQNHQWHVVRNAEGFIEGDDGAAQSIRNAEGFIKGDDGAAQSIRNAEGFIEGDNGAAQSIRAQKFVASLLLVSSSAIPEQIFGLSGVGYVSKGRQQNLRQHHIVVIFFYLQFSTVVILQKKNSRIEDYLLLSVGASKLKNVACIFLFAFRLQHGTEEDGML